MIQTLENAGNSLFDLRDEVMRKLDRTGCGYGVKAVVSRTLHGLRRRSTELMKKEVNLVYAFQLGING